MTLNKKQVAVIWITVTVIIPLLYVNVLRYRSYSDAIIDVDGLPEQRFRETSDSLLRVFIPSDSEIEEQKKYDAWWNSQPGMSAAAKQSFREISESATRKEGEFNRTLAEVLSTLSYDDFKKEALEKVREYKAKQQRLIVNASMISLILLSISGLSLYLLAPK